MTSKEMEMMILGQSLENLTGLLDLDGQQRHEEFLIVSSAEN